VFQFTSGDNLNHTSNAANDTVFSAITNRQRTTMHSGTCSQRLLGRALWGGPESINIGLESSATMIEE
jgi:hypothetical protein